MVQLFGSTITLDNLEHDIIRKRYSEPRIHMALVCAAKGCPTLFDKTERAVANYSSRYPSAADSDYLKTGGYSVKYLDYDWTLNQ